jgi:hypothetical protein
MENVFPSTAPGSTLTFLEEPRVGSLEGVCQVTNLCFVIRASLEWLRSSVRSA